MATGTAVATVADAIAATTIEVTSLPTSELRSHPLNIKIYGELETDTQFLDSIQRWGIIDPIVYQPIRLNGQKVENIIVSGHRRFLAARAFNLPTVPVRMAIPSSPVIENEADLLAMERLVIEANRQRVKNHVQIGREFIELKRIEERAAALRKTTGTAIGKDFPKGRARDIAAATLGISGRTAEKISKIIEKADAGNKVATKVLADISAKATTVSAGYLKALGVKSDKEDSTSNRSQRRQEFIKLHPEHADEKNSTIDKLLHAMEVAKSGSGVHHAQTPKEKLDARIIAIAPKETRYTGQHLQVQVNGDGYSPTTNTYSLIKVYVGRTVYMKTEAEAARLVKALIKCTTPAFKAAKLIDKPRT